MSETFIQTLKVDCNGLFKYYMVTKEGKNVQIPLVEFEDIREMNQRILTLNSKLTQIND